MPVRPLSDGGEPDGIRTHDPLIKSQLLYQLSYRPTTEALIRVRGAGGQGAKRLPLAKSCNAAYMRRMENRKAPSQIAFMKMHGAGNDFVIIDSRGRDAVVTATLAQALGDRHRGIGFDQLAEIRDSRNRRFRAGFLELLTAAAPGPAAMPPAACPIT